MNWLVLPNVMGKLKYIVHPMEIPTLFKKFTDSLFANAYCQGCV